MKRMRLLVILFLFSLQGSQLVLLFHRFVKGKWPPDFLHDDHMAKVVLSGTALLRPVQYGRTFLDNAKYENLLHVFTNANPREQLSG